MMDGLARDGDEDCGSSRSSLRELLRYRQHREELSEDGRAMFKEAVFQLISYHQDFDSLVKDATTTFRNSTTGEKNETEQESFSCSTSVSTCLEWLKERSSTSRLPVGVVAGDLLSDKLLQLANQGRRPESQLLQEEARAEVAAVLQLIEQLGENNFQKRQFLKLVCRKKSACLPLEMLYMLDNSGILPFDVYLSSKLTSEPAVSQALSSGLLVLCTSCGDDTIRKRIVSVLVGCLINESFSEKTPAGTGALLHKESLYILDLLTKGLLEEKLGHTQVLFPVTLALSYECLQRPALHKFCTHQLTVLFSYNPHLKVSRAIKEQADWTYSRISESRRAFFKQYFIVLEPETVLSILKVVLESQEVNWELVLSFTSTFLVCFTQAPKLLRDFTSALLKKGLENVEMDSTLVSFLLVRQGCYEGPHVFPTYQDWFHFTFSNQSKSPATSRKAFMFLMKFFTELVPFESALHLKAHIMKPPFVPANCRVALTEYLTLARTRLVDLKLEEKILGDGDKFFKMSEASIGADANQLLRLSVVLSSASFEMSTICENSNTEFDKRQEMEKTKQDVRRALLAFKATKQIPVIVMEASIFRKPYFIRRFLPKLLKLRPFPGDEDVKTKFIEALKKAEKLPKKMYLEYKKMCREEATGSLNDNFEIKDDEEMNKLVEPLDQLKLFMDQLLRAVQHSTAASNELKISELLSLISEKMGSLTLEVIGNDFTPQPFLQLNIANSRISLKLMQMIDIFLNAFGRIVSATFSSATPDFHWAHQMMDVVGHHEMLHHTFFVRLWVLLLLQGSLLSEAHITCLGALLCHIAICHKHFAPVMLGEPSELSPTSFCDLLWKMLPCTKDSEMKFLMRLSAEYLRTMFVSLSETPTEITKQKQLFPVNLMKKFSYVCTRLHPQLRCRNSTLESNMSMEMAVFTSEAFQEIYKHFELSFSEWLFLEVKLQPTQDHLCVRDRFEYHWWVVQDYCTSACQNHETPPYRKICSEIFRCLIAENSSCIDLDQGCSLCNKKCSSHSELWTDSGGILTLLQQLTFQLPQEADGRKDPETSNCPTQLSWLVGELAEALSSDGTTASEAQTQVDVLSVVWLTTWLPPYLLFTDCLAQPTLVSSNTCSTLVSLINTHLRNYLSQVCFLPLNFTVHLFQGLLLVKDHLLPSCELALTTCPLLWSSLLVHYGQLQYIAEQFMLSSEESRLKKLLIHISSLWNYKQKKLSGDFVDFPHGDFPYLDAVILFFLITDRRDFHLEKHWTSVTREAQLIYLECLINSIADAMFRQTTVLPTHVKAAADIIISSPSALATLLKKPPDVDEIINKLLPEHSIMLENVGIFRMILESFEAEQMGTVLQQPGNIGAFLQLHRDVCKIFDRSHCGRHVQQPCEPLCSPLKWQDMIQISTFVKQSIMSVPPQTLKTVDEQDLKECDLDVQMIIGEMTSAFI